MNSIILHDQSGIITDQKTLTHLIENLNAQIGQELKFTILNHGLAKGEILSLQNDRCEVKLQEITPGPRPWFNLIVGVSRPQTSKKVIEHGTTFGARGIHFFKAALSDKSYLTSKVFDADQALELALLGLSQSGIYSEAPEIKVDKFNPADNYQGFSQKFILDLTQSKSFLDYREEINFDLPICLAIGPERGFIKEDLERFKTAGFKSVKISSSILRVEHAIYASVAQLEMLRAKY